MLIEAPQEQAAVSECPKAGVQIGGVQNRPVQAVYRSDIYICGTEAPLTLLRRMVIVTVSYTYESVVRVKNSRWESCPSTVRPTCDRAYG